jgi:hypothetical protein
MGAQGGYGGGHGFEPERVGYGTQGYGTQGPQHAQVYDRQPDWASRRRHMVGNYGYGSDSYSSQSGSGSMYDQNQGVGMQGHFGGSSGGYGHVGNYGAEGGRTWQDQAPGPQQQGTRGSPQRMGQGHRGKGPKNFQRTDERIREAVSEALEIHDDIDATHIEVLVKNAEVILSGNVDTRDAKRLAEDVAASVSGVRDVQNQIKVDNERERGKSSSSMQRGEHGTSETTDSRKARA